MDINQIFKIIKNNFVRMKGNLLFNVFDTFILRIIGRIQMSILLLFLLLPHLFSQELIIRGKVINKIFDKGYRNKPLTEKQIANNKERSRTRVRVEHVFGF